MFEEMLALITVLGIKDTISWFATVLSAALVVDSWRGIVAQEAFFKENKTVESVRSKANSTLLKKLMGILYTHTSANVETVIGLLAAGLFLFPLFGAEYIDAEKIVSITSSVVSAGIVITLILSRRGNRIVFMIIQAKPHLDFRGKRNRRESNK